VASLAEPDSRVEYGTDGRSAIGLRIAAAACASQLDLGEHEVAVGHHSGGRVRRQSRDDVVTQLERGRRSVSGRSSLGEVWEQRHVTVRLRLAVVEREIAIVNLSTLNSNQSVNQNIFRWLK